MSISTDKQPHWKKFICLACGYIYDEQAGDPTSGLPAGTRFDDIPDDWHCPVCGVTKDGFEPYDEHQISSTDSTHEQGVVIIGAGLAGWSVVDALRTLNKDIPITLICADLGDRYHKPMLSVAISQGKTAQELVRTTAVQSAKDNQITLLANTVVTSIDTATQTVHTSSDSISYDHLVLAIGATPAYPPTINPKATWHVNNLEQFSKLQATLNHQDAPRHIAIIGAGMVGTELAEDLINAGHTVSLIDVNAYPLSAMLPMVAGERILAAIINKGISWLGSSMVKAISENQSGGHDITLHDGTDSEQTVHADEVIVATGLVIDEQLPAQAGLDFDRRTGIAINPATLQTSVPNIYALGDCISIHGTPCRYVAPHRAQATAIAHEILGLPHAGYEHKAPMIRLKNKSINVTANGNPRADGDWHIIKDDKDELSLELHDGGQVIAKALLKSPQS